MGSGQFDDAAQTHDNRRIRGNRGYQAMAHDRGLMAFRRRPEDGSHIEESKFQSPLKRAEERETREPAAELLI